MALVFLLREMQTIAEQGRHAPLIAEPASEPAARGITPTQKRALNASGDRLDVEIDDLSTAIFRCTVDELTVDQAGCLIDAVTHRQRGETEYAHANVLEPGIRQAIAVHNEALLENLPTPPVDRLLEVVREHLASPATTLNAQENESHRDLLHSARCMIEAFLASAHAKLSPGHQIVGIEQRVAGLLGEGLPPDARCADLVTLGSQGVFITNYRLLDPTRRRQSIREHAKVLSQVGPLIAATVDPHARLAGLRLVTITHGQVPVVDMHRLSVMHASTS